MKYLFYMLFAPQLLMSCNNGAEEYVPPEPKPPVNPVAVVAHKRAKEMYDLVNLKYKTEISNFFTESSPIQTGDPKYSYLWPFVAMTNGSATLKQLGYNIPYSDIVENFERYHSTGANGNTIPGYNSGTKGSVGSGTGTRFYDDNAITGISLVEAYNITKNTTYISRAKKTAEFIKSGIDNVLGGAMWWNEDQKNITSPYTENSNKPACANGYATLFFLEYYKVCDPGEKADVLDVAKQLYSWLRSNLYDASTKCYWNDKNANGNINRTIWTYNTGVMIQNGIRLYQITGEQHYLDEAKTSAAGAFDYFVKMSNTTGQLAYPDHDPWFNTKLLRAFIDIQPYYSNADSYITTYFNYINYGYDKARAAGGLFREDWTGAKTNAARDASLLMQAAVIESYGAIAMYKKEKID